MEAERAFEEVVQLDETCSEAYSEIRRIRVARIVEVGFPEARAAEAVARYSTVQVRERGREWERGKKIIRREND